MSTTHNEKRIYPESRKEKKGLEVKGGKAMAKKMIVNASQQEDVDGIGISLLLGADMHIFSKIIGLLKERNAEDITVFGGGIIPPAKRFGT